MESGISYNLEYERAIVGGLMVDESGDALAIVENDLTPEDFYDNEYRIIFRTIAEMAKNNAVPISFITVSDHFRKHPVSGYDFNFDKLKAIAENFDSMAKFRFYVSKVIEYSQQRLHGDIDSKINILQAERDRLQRVSIKEKDGEGVKELVFPEKVIDGVAGDFAKLYADKMESPIEFFFFSFLTILGNLICNRVKISSELNTQPRLYTLLLGESGTPRKSTSNDKTLEFFEYALVRDSLHYSKGLASAEGMYKILNEVADEKGIKKLLLFYDEFKQFVSKANIQNSVLLPAVNSLFESNHFENRTKKVKEVHEKVYLSILAASTSDTYRNTWTSAFTDIGFNNRLFIVPGRGERKFSIPCKISDESKSPIKNGLGDILRLCESGLELTLIKSAYDLYDEWYLNLDSSIHTKRIDTYALRLMQLLAVNNLKDEIDLTTIEKTIEICNWQISARRLYDPIDAENKIAVIENAIRSVLSIFKSIKESELKKRIHYERFGNHLYMWARKNMIAEGEIERVPVGKKSAMIKLVKSE